MKMKQKIQSQKPIKQEVSLLYICTNQNCRNQHWLFLHETQTKNFKVVCECGEIFKPKLISSIEIHYDTSKKKKSKQKFHIPKVPIKPIKQIQGVPVDIMESCVKLLCGYGFTSVESMDLIGKAYSQTEDKTAIGIIKTVLNSLEIQDV
jgi:hypothetical protein